jgi:hypothetical protein
MAIALPTGYLRTTIEPLDVRYNNELTGNPYANVAAAFAATQFIAYPGLFVNISDGTTTGSDLYWYKSLSNPAVVSDIVAFSAGGGGSFFIPPTSGGVVVGTTAPTTGAYQQGYIFPNAPQSMQDMWKNMLFPYVQPVITGALLPLTNFYNAQNVTIQPNIGSGPFFFIWTKISGAPNLVSAIIEVRRVPAIGPPTPWIQLATTVTTGSPTVENIDLTSPLIINQTTVPDNSTFQMRCEFVDANSVTPYYSSTISSTFAAYAAPVTNNLSVIPKDATGTSLLSAGTIKYVRSFVTYKQTDITGTLNGNTPLVDMTSYEFRYSSGGGYIALAGSQSSVNLPNSGIAPTGTPVAMQAFADLNSIAGTNDYFIQTYVETTNAPGSYLPINIIKSYNMYPPVFAGLISDATYLGPVSGWLPAVFNTFPYTAQALIPNGSSNNGGVCNYQRNANDRLLTGLNFITSNTPNDRFIVAYPDIYPAMTLFGSISQNFANNFYPAGTPPPHNSPVPIIQSVTFGDNTTITYKIYIYGLALSTNSSFGPYELA